VLAITHHNDIIISKNYLIFVIGRHM